MAKIYLGINAIKDGANIMCAKKRIKLPKEMKHSHQAQMHL